MDIDPDLVRLVDLFLGSKYRVRARVPLSWKPGSYPPSFPPHEMLCGLPDERGLVEWEPVDSPIDEEMVHGFERFLGVRLPPLFRSYLKYKCLLEADLNFLILPEIDPRHPLGWLEYSLKASRYPAIRAKPWYIPFVDSSAQMGYLCFDTSRPDGAGDYPIMKVCDIDSLTFRIKEDIELFPSFRSYVRYGCNFILYSRYIDENPAGPLTLGAWLESRGLPVPHAVRHAQPWYY